MPHRKILDHLEAKGWISSVHTETVNTPKGVTLLPAKEMAETLLKANKDISQGSLIRFLQFHINRAGIGMSEERKNEIRKAQEILRHFEK